MEDYLGILVFIVFIVISIITSALKRTSRKGSIERYRGYREPLWSTGASPPQEEKRPQPPPQKLPLIVEEERISEEEKGIPSPTQHRLESTMEQRRITSIRESIDTFERRLERIFGEDYTDYEDVESRIVGGGIPLEGMSEWARLIAFHNIFRKRYLFMRRWGIRR